MNPVDIEAEHTDLPIDVNPPTTEEIRMAIRQIKNRKAAGPDNIPAEALKSDVEATTKDCQYYPELIRLTTVQGRAWRTADRCIPSKDRSQTRLLLSPVPLSSGGRLDYEDLDI
ncbi:unnamed protein product [Schistosoma curassoni]|uniref:Reverse transcriptase domain-containing protein n=1 Tax=Schistosoma curassoni TaxID=6186 RepID=A0A183L825_9TREM|nr:unnamed protein product [Schistosoma curassoni]